MTPKNFLLDDPLHDYLMAHATPIDDIEQALIAETQALGDVGGMQIAPEQGAFMALMTRLVGAREAIEVGTFTGYSALSVARALPPPPDGRLVCCDINDEWTAVARKFWRQAGVDDRIELRLGPALETLQSLGHYEQFDVAFIDADKGNYIAYYEELLPRMRRRSVMFVDNVLWGGKVVDPSEAEPDVVAIREFNDRVAADERVESVILPIGDGVSVIRKR